VLEMSVHGVVVQIRRLVPSSSGEARGSFT
jgi:hypothetical protein